MNECKKVQELIKDYENLKRSYIILTKEEKKTELLKLKSRAKEILFSDEECFSCKQEVSSFFTSFSLS